MLSGGWESTACLIKAVRSGGEVTAVFFDYGQPYVKQETKAVAKISTLFDFHFSYHKIKDMERKGKVFVNRNRHFLHAAMHYEPTEIWFGARAPLHLFDAYKDSNWQFAQEMGRELGVKIKTPLILWPKPLIKYYVKKGGVTEDKIFSSERFKYEAQ